MRNDAIRRRPPDATDPGVRTTLVAVLGGVALVAVALVAVVVGLDTTQQSEPSSLQGEPRNVETAEPVPRPTSPRSPELETGQSVSNAVDGWQALPLAPIHPRTGHSLVWTGRCREISAELGRGEVGGHDSAPPACGEVLIWGGTTQGNDAARDGAAYDPVFGIWRTISPGPRHHDPRVPVVWTGPTPEQPGSGSSGGHLVVWGATAAELGADTGDEPRGAAYDPRHDDWRALPEAPIEARVGHTLDWNGSVVFAWGGHSTGPDPEPFATGAAYDGTTDTWRQLPDPPIAARTGHAATAIPDGRLFVFGGFADATHRHPLSDGAIFDPSTDSWRVVARPPDGITSLQDGGRPAATWMDHGQQGTVYVAIPARSRAGSEPVLLAYDLATHTWSPLPSLPLELQEDVELTPFAAGRDLLVWSARGQGADTTGDGAMLSASTGTWIRLAGPPAGLGSAILATDFEVLSWGGVDTGDPVAGGAHLDTDGEVPPRDELRLAPESAWQVWIRPGRWHSTRPVHLTGHRRTLGVVVESEDPADITARLVGVRDGSRVMMVPADRAPGCGTADDGSWCRFTFDVGISRPVDTWHLALTVDVDRNTTVVVELD